VKRLDVKELRLGEAILVDPVGRDLFSWGCDMGGKSWGESQNLVGGTVDAAFGDLVAVFRPGGLVDISDMERNVGFR